MNYIMNSSKQKRWVRRTETGIDRDRNKNKTTTPRRDETWRRRRPRDPETEIETETETRLKRGPSRDQDETRWDETSDETRPKRDRNEITTDPNRDRYQDENLWSVTLVKFKVNGEGVASSDIESILTTPRPLEWCLYSLKKQERKTNHSFRIGKILWETTINTIAKNIF